MNTTIRSSAAAAAGIALIVATAATFTSRPADGAPPKPPDEVRVVNTPLEIKGEVTVGNTVDVSVGNVPAVTLANAPTVHVGSPVAISNFPSSDVKLPWSHNMLVPLPIPSQDVETCHSMPAGKRIVIEMISIRGEASHSPEDRWFAHLTTEIGGHTIGTHMQLNRVFQQIEGSGMDLYGLTQPVTLRLDTGSQICASIQRFTGFVSGGAFFSLSGYQTDDAPGPVPGL